MASPPLDTPMSGIYFTAISEQSMADIPMSGTGPLATSAQSAADSPMGGTGPDYGRTSSDRDNSYGVGYYQRSPPTGPRPRCASMQSSSNWYDNDRRQRDLQRQRRESSPQGHITVDFTPPKSRGPRMSANGRLRPQTRYCISSNRNHGGVGQNTNQPAAVSQSVNVQSGFQITSSSDRRLGLPSMQRVITPPTNNVQPEFQSSHSSAGGLHFSGIFPVGAPAIGNVQQAQNPFSTGSLSQPRVNGGSQESVSPELADLQASLDKDKAGLQAVTATPSQTPRQQERAVAPQSVRNHQPNLGHSGREDPGILTHERDEAIEQALAGQAELERLKEVQALTKERDDAELVKKQLKVDKENLRKELEEEKKKREAAEGTYSQFYERVRVQCEKGNNDLAASQDAVKATTQRLSVSQTNVEELTNQLHEATEKLAELKRQAQESRKNIDEYHARLLTSWRREVDTRDKDNASLRRANSNLIKRRKDVQEQITALEGTVQKLMNIGRALLTELDKPVRHRWGTFRPTSAEAPSLVQAAADLLAMHGDENNGDSEVSNETRYPEEHTPMPDRVSSPRTHQQLTVPRTMSLGKITKSQSLQRLKGKISSLQQKVRSICTNPNSETANGFKGHPVTVLWDLPKVKIAGPDSRYPSPERNAAKSIKPNVLHNNGADDDAAAITNPPSQVSQQEKHGRPVLQPRSANTMTRGSAPGAGPEDSSIPGGAAHSDMTSKPSTAQKKRKWCLPGCYDPNDLWACLIPGEPRAIGEPENVGIVGGPPAPKRRKAN